MTAFTDTAGLVGHGIGRVSEAVFGQVLAALIAFGFGFARAIGMVAILPIFTRLSLGMMLRAGVAFALALVVAPPLDAAVAPFMAGHPAQLPARVLFLLVKEDGVDGSHRHQRATMRVVKTCNKGAAHNDH